MGFFIDSLCEFFVWWDMEPYPHTFHPSKHPKKK